MAWCCQAPSHYLNLCRANSLKHVCITRPQCVNTLRPRQNRHHFTDDTFKRIFVNENVGVLIEISLKFVPKGPINNIPALVQIMAWRRPGDKPLSEPMMVCLPTHICVTRPQWVKCCILPDGTVYQLQLRWWVGDIWEKLDNPLRQIILAELYNVFSCDQAALWMVQSVRLSVCPSVCLSVRPSVCLSHLFDYVPIILSSWNFQELLPVTKVTSMQKVKVRGQRSRSQRSQPNLTVSGL